MIFPFWGQGSWIARGEIHGAIYKYGREMLNMDKKW